MSANSSVFWRLLPEGNSGSIVALLVGHSSSSRLDEIVLALSDARPIAISRKSRAFRLLCELNDVVPSEGIGAIVLVEKDGMNRAIVRTRFRFAEDDERTTETFVRCSFSWSPVGDGNVVLKADEIFPELVVARVERSVRDDSRRWFTWTIPSVRGEKIANNLFESLRGGGQESERAAMNEAVFALRSLATERTDAETSTREGEKNAAEAVPRLRPAIEALDAAGRTAERLRR